MSKKNRVKLEHTREEEAARQALTTKAGKRVLRAAMEEEFGRFVDNWAWTCLFILHRCFRFGPKRLRRFLRFYNYVLEKVKDYYFLESKDLPYITEKIMLDKYNMTLAEFEAAALAEPVEAIDLGI